MKNIAVIAHPSSKKPRIVKDGENLHIYVSEPPIEGKANRAVMRALAGFMGVLRSKVRLVRGQRGKIKIFSIG